MNDRPRIQVVLDYSVYQGIIRTLRKYADNLPHWAAAENRYARWLANTLALDGVAVEEGEEG